VQSGGREEPDKQSFLFMSPLPPEARREIDDSLRRNPRVGDTPLFPAPGKKPAKWRRRSLAGKRYPYLIIDAHYEQLRREGSVRSTAVL
jgi:hypothetical protein